MDENSPASGSVSTQSRRGFLGSLMLSISLSVLSGESGADSSDRDGGAEASLRDTSDQENGEIPPYPDDPFIQPAFGIQYILGWEDFGWEDVGTETVQETILGLRPDVLAFDQLLDYEDGRVNRYFPGGGYNDQFTLAQDLDLPATSGMNVHIVTDEEEARFRYGPIAEESEWAFPDGAPLESPTDILGETFDGEPHRTEFEFETLGTPSVFAPGGLELMFTATEAQLEKGYSGFFVDGVGVFRLHGLDFSRWARSAFRNHLRSLSDDELAALRIEEPQSFDMREYVEANDLTPDDDVDPRGDPVFREYMLHQHEGIDDWFDDYRDRVEARFPERTENGEIALYANQFTGNLENPQAPNVYVSDSMDVMYTELFPTGDPASDVNYKIMRSVGNFSKPVVAKGTLAAGNPALPDGLDADAANNAFQRLQLAEAYATGARLQLPLTNRLGYSEEDSVTNWVAGDGTVPDELSSFVEFLWAHERLLTDLEPAGDVAIIWSLPTQVWRREQSWGFDSDDEGGSVDSFTTAASALREAGFSYDVLTFGHPRLWDESVQLDRLAEYEAVVLAGVTSVSDGQVSALRTYLDDGGTVLCTDSAPGRDAMYEPRNDIAAFFERDGAAVIDGSSDDQGGSETGPGGPLSGALEDQDVVPARRTEDPNIAVHTHSQSDPDRYVLPLVNYDYDPETDSFSVKSDVSVRVPTTGSGEHAIRYYSPTETAELSVTERDGSPHVTVPELVEWGIVVVSETEGELRPAVSEEAAADAIETARESLEGAEERGRPTGTALVAARSKLQAAEMAMSFDAYGQAETVATEVIDITGSSGDGDGAAAETDETAGGNASDEDGSSNRSTADGDGNRSQNTTDGEGVDTRDPTDDETPGFGAATAVLGITGGAYLLKRLLAGSEKESS